MKNDNTNKEYTNGTNTVVLEGYVETLPQFHHQTYGEGIYSFIIRIPRLNAEVCDLLRVEISERLLNLDDFYEGAGIHIGGQMRSFNKRNEETKRASLELSVFAKEAEIIDPDSVKNLNKIELEGYLCK